MSSWAPFPLVQPAGTNLAAKLRVLMRESSSCLEQLEWLAQVFRKWCMAESLSEGRQEEESSNMPRYLRQVFGPSNLSFAIGMPRAVERDVKVCRWCVRVIGSDDKFPSPHLHGQPSWHCSQEKVREMHFSYPPGSSVNDGIDNALFLLRYSTVYDFVSKGAVMAKVNIKSAFSLCPVQSQTISSLV